MKNNNDYKILFVDDEEKAVKYFEKIYSKDFSILVSNNVVDAKKILDENSDCIAILLTDQRMPEQKGTELLSYSRQNYPHIIRLLTTAYSDLGDAIEAVNSGEILRYLTKPWDINVLRADLKYAMNFFLMRHERDLLLKEKLNVKQRLVELNRARDLIVMASSFTHLRNPLHAISSLLMQLPNLKQTHIADLHGLDTWDLIQNEIHEYLTIVNEIIRETESDNKFKSDFSLDALIKNSAIKDNKKIELNIISSPSIKFNKLLIEKMLNGILELLLSSGSDNEILKVSVEAVSEGGKIVFYGKGFDMEVTSILNMPVELLAAFFISYHHGGEVVIDISDGTTFEVSLPSEPEKYQLSMLDDDWLESIFERFEQWPE